MGKHIQPTGKRVAEIFETKDYSIFKEHRDNRVINQSHVKKLSENGYQPQELLSTKKVN